MKTKSLIIFVISSVLLVTTVITVNFKSERNYQPRKSIISNSEQDANGAIEWLKRRRVNLQTGKIDYNDIINAQNELAAFRQKKSANSLGLDWIEMGPNNVGGRTRAILVDNQDDNLIFAGGVGGGLWKTTTNGTSWTKVNGSDTWENMNICSITQTKDGDIYVGTGEGLYYNSGEGTGGLEGQGIWKSTDRGNSFSRIPSTWSEDSINGIPVKAYFVDVNKLAVDPTDNNTVYASTEKGLLVTHDGGNTWENPVIDRFINNKPFYINSKSTDVKVATDGSLIASIGNTPYLADGKLYTRNLSSITKSTDDLMLVFGETGIVLQSVNSGNSFTNLNSGLTSNLLSYAQLTNSTGIAVGNFGKIYKTTDNGSHWKTIPSNTYTDLNCVTFVSGKTGHLVGKDGLIMKTTNGGDTWVSLNSGTKNLNSISFGSLSFGFIVGDNATVKKTVNGGTAWTNVTINSSITTQNLNSVYTLNSTKAFAAGDSGTIIKTGNGGTSWVALTSNVNINLKSIHFITDSIGLAVGENGTIIKTSDAGTNWNTITSGTTSSLNSVFFVNNLTGYITGNNGILLKTSNAGDTWTTANSGTSKNLYALYTNEFSKIKTTTDHSLSVGDIVSLKTSITGLTTEGMVYAVPSSNEILINIPYLMDTVGLTGIITNLMDLSDRSALNPNATRLEFSFAPSDPNYIYCSAAKSGGVLENIYQSKNKGLTWEIIGAGDNPLFDPFRNQGDYDNVIAVYPDNKDNALLGGIDIWKKIGAKFFEQITLWNANGASYYVHADIHTIVFHPKYNTNKTLYVGCDGGVFKSTDGGISFNPINKNYNVTQFYSVAASPTGSVIGGCQDNGTQMINFKGNTYQSAFEVSGGDGGYTHFSVLDPNVIFSSVYNGTVYRSQDKGSSVSTFISGGAGGNFVTPFRVFENFHDTLSIDSILVDYIAENPIAKDSVIDIIGESNTNARPLYSKYKVPNALAKNQKISVKVQDYYQAFFASGMTNLIYVSRYPLDFSRDSTVQCATNIVGQVETFEFSKDGNYLYIATTNKVYRIDSLYKFRTTKQLKTITADLIGSFGQTITSLAVDPQNPENVVVTLGNYGYDNHVYYSTNAATTTSPSGNFISVQEALPKIPVYSSLILWNDSKKILIGTEYGVFSTSDISADSVIWSEESSFPHVATFMLRQQTFENTWEHGVYNHGFIYAATHGRGVWRSETNKGPVAVPMISKNDETAKIQVYPNPTSDYANISLTLTNSTNGTLSVYDINGRLVKKLDLELTSGSNKINFNVNDLQKGTYFISIKTEIKQYSTKMIVL